MPSWLSEVLKLLGLSTPFIYAAAAYGIFHWLDKKASGNAKKAITEWLQPKTTSAEALGAAIVELFNRIYTSNLLSWRAFVRSASLSLFFLMVVLFEIYNGMGFKPFQDAGAVTDYISVVITNITSDYCSLFVVKRLLIKHKARPLQALWTGPILGMLVVGAFIVVQSVLLTVLMWGPPVWLLLMLRILVTFESNVWAGFTLAALIVHLWLPVLFLSVSVLRGLNYLRSAVGWTQWFIKQGQHHPLQAIGYVAGLLVFVSSAILQHLT